MSLIALGWAWAQPLKSTEKLVLLALADHANEDDICWPSIKRIAERTGLSKRSVTTGLAALEEKGLVIRERRVRGDNSNTSSLTRLDVHSVINNFARDGAPDSIGGEAGAIAPMEGDAPHEPPYINRHMNRNENVRTPRKSQSDYSPEFEAFWQVYPKRSGKGGAWKEWNALSPDEDLQLVMCDAVREQTLWREQATEASVFMAQWLDPERWIKRRKWEDEMPPELAAWNDDGPSDYERIPHARDVIAEIERRQAQA